jgi:hypothetical protein
MASKSVTRMLLTCLVLLTSERSLAGRMFEWVDQNGTTHFSDRAPAGQPFREKTVRPASGAALPGIETGIRDAERDLLKNARREDAEIKRARQATARQLEQRQSRCRQARSRYRETTHRPGKEGGADYKTLRREMNKACD